MRRTVMVMLGLLVVAAARPAAAQRDSERLELSLFAGTVVFDPPDSQQGPLAGLRVGYNATDNLEVEACADYSRPELGYGAAVDGTTFGIDLLYNADRTRMGRGYFVVGAGWGGGDYSGMRFWEVGGGYRWRLNDVLAARLDARAFIAGATQPPGAYNRGHAKISLGVSALLGGRQ
jgi:hypothetical protein